MLNGIISYQRMHLINAPCSEMALKHCYKVIHPPMLDNSEKYDRWLSIHKNFFEGCCEKNKP